MGPSTGVSLTPPRRRRERTSSTRFRVATSMRWKFIVPTRTCRICSLLRFDGKKWCFSRLSNCWTVQAHCRSPTGRSSTGSNAPRPYKWLGRRMQRATMDVIYTSGEIAIAMQPAMRTWRGRLIPRAYACMHAPLFGLRVQWRSCTQLLQLRNRPLYLLLSGFN